MISVQTITRQRERERERDTESRNQLIGSCLKGEMFYFFNKIDTFSTASKIIQLFPVFGYRGEYYFPDVLIKIS